MWKLKTCLSYGVQASNALRSGTGCVCWFCHCLAVWKRLEGMVSQDRSDTTVSQRSLESVAVCTGECGRFFFSCISRKHGLSELGLVSLSGSRRKEDRKGRRQACVCVPQWLPPSQQAQPSWKECKSIPEWSYPWAKASGGIPEFPFGLDWRVSLVPPSLTHPCLILKGSLGMYLQEPKLQAESWPAVMYRKVVNLPRNNWNFSSASLITVNNPCGNQRGTLTFSSALTS